MKKFFIPSRKWIVSLALVGSATVSFAFADRYFEIARNLEILAKVFREVNKLYVEEINPSELMTTGIEAMLASLDPYTEFIDESNLEEYKMHYVSTQYAGIGASIFIKDDKVTVAEPYEGYAAQKADLRAGDVILEINGVPLHGKNYDEVNALLKGQANTRVRMLVQRKGTPRPLDKLLVRENIRFRNVPYYGLLTDSIGYIKLNKFLINSAKEVKEALVSLKQDNHITSLVLDLRGNGGGIVQESVSIVNLFVEKGQPIATQTGRTRDRDLVYKATQNPVDTRLPLVVLVDQYSASASEIVAGAIQDLDRGSIIGQRTFGKGLVQQAIPLSYNTLLKLTVGKFLTPSGRCLQALDYTHQAADGTASRFSDSLLVEYKTKKGRLVYDGSGIYPDLITKDKKYPPIVYSLMAHSLPFDYATSFRATRPTLPAAREFQLSDTVYADFVRFASTRDFGYTTETEQALAELKSKAQQSKQFEDIKTEYEVLTRKVNHNKQEDLLTFKADVKQILESEIVSRYYYQTGKLEASFKHDADVSEAIRVLHDHKLYASILRGDGPYKVIGRPKPDAYVKANVPVAEGQEE